MRGGGATEVIDASGFREYDLRWTYPDQINEAGMHKVGRAIAAQLFAHRKPPRIVVGHDFRSYSERLKTSLCEGLVEAGVEVHDIGLALSPMAYFARAHLGVDAVAMLTASHNPNGWTGLKLGFEPPLTHGPEQIQDLYGIITRDATMRRPGGRILDATAVRHAYIDDLCKGGPLRNTLKVVCATGNGTASVFAPQVLRRIGVDVVERHCALDAEFPHYNPDPESLEMLDDMALALRGTGADCAFGFDGDGDRLGVVNETGERVWSDRVGLVLARALAPAHLGRRMIVDVKSTGLFATDPVLKEHDVAVDYWKTGHSHIKRGLRDQGALAAFERSGHFYFAPPLGRGYDCALTAAVMLCRILDDAPAGQSLSALAAAPGPSYTSPALSPACPDDAKYEVVARLCDRLSDMRDQGARFAGRSISALNTVNGVRIQLEDGGWGLIRASSNTPNLVVIAESLISESAMVETLDGIAALLREEPDVGPLKGYR